MGEAVCGARGQTITRTLHDTAGMIDEQGAGTDDSIPRSQHDQVSLRLGRSVMDGREQRRIQTRQSGEYFGIGAVAFTGVVIDRS